MDCQIDSGPCSKTAGTDRQTRVTLDITPKPVVPMKRLRFSVTVRRGEKAVEDADVSLGLSMPGMYMMENRVPLRHFSEGRYEGEGVIVRCSSGKRIWRADISVRRQGEGGQVEGQFFLFRVAR